MKRILLVILLLGALYFILQFALAQLHSFTQNASLIMSGIYSDKIQLQVRAIVKKTVLNNASLASDAKIILEPFYINADTQKDIVARVESTQTCGTGGCTTLILLKNDSGAFEPITFAYTIKKLEVLNSITQQMHDLRINDDASSVMAWDGEQYQIQSVQN